MLNKSFHKNFLNYNFHTLYKDLLNFCSQDLSSFYFDIRKDILYCDPLNSKKRKSCVKILNIFLNLQQTILIAIMMIISKYKRPRI